MKKIIQILVLVLLSALIINCENDPGFEPVVITPKTPPKTAIPTYTTTYIGNGGTPVPIDTNTYTNGHTVIVDEGELIKRDGYSFLRWTNSLGSNVIGSFVMGSNNVTLYADWSFIPMYTVTYNGNGGTSVPLDTNYYTNGQSVIVDDGSTINKTGYTFNGWSNTTGQTVSGSFVMDSNSVNLYAKWTPNVYTITFNANGGTGTMSDQQITYDTPEPLNTCTFTKSGYLFSGWSTNNTGPTLYRQNTSYSIGSNNVELFAIWSLPFVLLPESLAEEHSLFLKTDGSLWATGNNYFGQFGNGESGSYVNNPTPIKIMDGVSNISVNRKHSLILKTDNTLWGVGRNVEGQLGSGSSTISTPKHISSSVASVSTGYYHTVYVLTTSQLMVLGDNRYGQLGTGNTVNKSTPTVIMSGVKSVSSGYFHTMILKTDNTLWATGYNNYGQLGDGTTSNRLTPVQVMSNVQSVFAGDKRTFIIKTDGSLWATGDNTRGQLGDGTTTHRQTPIQIMSSVKGVSSKFDTTMIIKTDGTLWASGYNNYGSFGSPYYPTGSSIPIHIMSDVKLVATGQYHVLIQKTDGTLWGTGQGHHGQLGYGGLNNQPTPVQIYP